jgi:hypothetical protein
MPATGPQLLVAFSSSTDEEGWPICVRCNKRLRAQFGGYGYNGNGHFCTIRCAAEWADLKVQGVC